MSQLRALQPETDANELAGDAVVRCTPEDVKAGRTDCRARIALLSNPNSTQNMARLPLIRDYCATAPDIFHYEVDAAEETGEALRVIARVKPAILVINGGDGTVQAVLTELHNGDAFAGEVPPVAVLPSGKTNLIALDLGAESDPIKMLERLRAILAGGVEPHIVSRELIALSTGDNDNKPVIGMFLGGAGLADIMLYCREKIYPIGLPNSISHVLTAFAVLAQQLFGLKARSLPPEPRQMRLDYAGHAPLDGRFAMLMVTTLEKLLLNQEIGDTRGGGLKLIAVEHGRRRLLKALWASVTGALTRKKLDGVLVEQTDRIEISGEASEVILDGESFRAEEGSSLLLKPANPIRFVRLAA